MGSSAPTRRSSKAQPRRIVAIGGGTGLPAVLRGMRRILAPANGSGLTAIVTMTDDGGSSGRLRRTRGVLPPGDVRNCLVALSEDEDLLASLFQYRYAGESELGGHSLGNLILTALAEETGSFLNAVEMTSRVLRINGRILPSTLDDVVLEARLEDGSQLRGESVIGDCSRRIERIALSPADAGPTPGVLEAIGRADLVVLGPGSLFTSLLPNLVVRGVAQALREARATRVLVANLVCEHGEAADLDLEDHIRLIEEHCGGRCIDGVLAHDGPIDPSTLERYRAEGTRPLSLPRVSRAVPLIVKRPLIDDVPKLRHIPRATAEGVLAVWSAVSQAAVTERRR